MNLVFYTLVAGAIGAGQHNLDAARAAEKAGQYDNALPLIESALASSDLTPAERADALVLRAQAEKALGRTDAALAD